MEHPTGTSAASPDAALGVLGPPAIAAGEGAGGGAGDGAGDGAATSGQLGAVPAGWCHVVIGEPPLFELTRRSEAAEAEAIAAVVVKAASDGGNAAEYAEHCAKRPKVASSDLPSLY